MADIQEIILEEVRAARKAAEDAKSLGGRLDERTLAMQSDIEEMKPEIERNKKFRHRVYALVAAGGVGGGSLSATLAKLWPFAG